ncbi:biotin biosynthesis protein BioC [Thiorhodococcus drewsii AZ1]|uniref:Malonyl-[acyl-carrier protein] O-methyltransferase n=1 Tax=Thiorhodococcus drewsii AZ1 TaxID=765913 RepID=G2E065_9GAMM|nr:malonyl-ACP O-methyltransferase BioC [Thiorhodococcus drewsii]EGV31793.1 biotin biosynthesis protein BioC [Thiorhodococcus drewsii AZ1]
MSDIANDIPPIDKARARRSFDQAASRYDSVAVLQREIADRLIERLDYIRLEPARVLDLGTGTGYALDGLSKRYRKAQLVALDFAQSMLKQARRRGSWLRRPTCVCADAESLPLADGSVDLIVSSATIQWCNDLDRTFAECLRVLRPGGLLMFTTFGPDTLKELRQAWSQVDRHSHVSPFLDMHDIGDALVRTRFADPVMDAERMTLTYDRVHDLMRDLKVLGARNATQDRPRALSGRKRLTAVESAYESHRRDGRLPASYEVLYGHAWAPEQKPVTGGIAVPIPSIGSRRHAKPDSDRRHPGRTA